MPAWSVAPSGMSEATYRPNLAVDLTRRIVRVLEQVSIHGHHAMDPPRVDERVSVRPRHPRVHLGEHEVCRVHGRPDDIDRDAEARVAMLVRRAHLDQGDVDANPVTANQLGNLREEDRQKFRSALLHCVPDVRPDEERDVAEAVLEPRCNIGGRPEGQQMDDNVVSEVIAVPNEPLYEGDWLGRARGDEDGPSPRDAADGPFRSGELGGVRPLPVWCECSSSPRAFVIPAHAHGYATGQPLGQDASERSYASCTLLAS